MKKSFGFAIATLTAVFPILLTSTLRAQPLSAAGPKISRVVAFRPQPVFERVEHPSAKAGRKIVVIEVPSGLKSAFERDEVYAGVTFSAPRPTDNCNETKVYGVVTERAVPAMSDLKYGVLEVKPSRISKTMKECIEVKHEVRPVEIVTELRGPSPFRDTLVFDVPEDVEATATFWSPISSASAVRAD
jgi:hypothetical protein